MIMPKRSTHHSCTIRIQLNFSFSTYNYKSIRIHQKQQFNSFIWSKRLYSPKPQNLILRPPNLISLRNFAEGKCHRKNLDWCFHWQAFSFHLNKLNRDSRVLKKTYNVHGLQQSLNVTNEQGSWLKFNTIYWMHWS